MDRHGKHHVIDSGPLPEAVAASAAIPVLFKGVNIPGETERERGVDQRGACLHAFLAPLPSTLSALAGRERDNPFKDGGVVDRVGVSAWRDRRRRQLAAGEKRGVVPPALLHVIYRWEGGWKIRGEPTLKRALVWDERQAIAEGVGNRPSES